ncbi:hypothetical protein [Stutzerimonas marianensis]
MARLALDSDCQLGANELAIINGWIEAPPLYPLIYTPRERADVGQRS